MSTTPTLNWTKIQEQVELISSKLTSMGVSLETAVDIAAGCTLYGAMVKQCGGNLSAAGCDLLATEAIAIVKERKV